MSGETPTGGTTPSAKVGRGRRVLRGVWRWTRRLALAAAVVLLLARVTMPLWLPRVVQGVARDHDLHVSWTDLDLSILGLSVDLGGVRAVPLGPDGDASEVATTQPLVRVDDVGVDVDVSALFGGRIAVHRLEVSGVEAWLERDSEGAWNFERHLATGPGGDTSSEGASKEASKEASEAARERAAAEAAKDAGAKTLDFRSPVEVVTLAVSGVRLHLDDALAEPALSTTLELDVLVRDVGHDSRPLGLRVVARADDGVLDLLRVEGEVRAGEATLGADLDVELIGLGVRRLSPYLEPLGIRPEANKLNARLRAEVDLAPLAPAPGATDDGVLDLAGSIVLRSLALDADGDPALGLGPATIDIRRARSTRFEIDEVLISQLAGRATRLPGGGLRVAGLDFVGAPPAPPETETEPDVDDAEAAGAPIVLDVARIALEEASFTLDDLSLEPPTTLTLSAAATIDQLVLDPDRPGQPLAFTLRAAVEDALALVLEGQAIPTGPTPGAFVQLKGDGITLAALRPYLEAAGLESTLTSGTLGGSLSAQVTPGLDGAPTVVNASLDNLVLRDGSTRHLLLKAVRLENLSTKSDGTGLESLSVRGGFVPLELMPNGAFRAAGVQSLGLLESARGRDLGIADAKVDLSDFSLGGEGTRATLRAQAALTGVADALSLEASIVTRPGPLDLEFNGKLGGDGLGLEGLRDLLAASGIEPIFERGALRAAFAGEVRQVDDTLTASARAFDVAFESGGAAVLSLAEASVTDLVMAPGSTSIAEVLVRDPVLAASRTADGAIEVLGLRLGMAARGGSEPLMDEGAASGSTQVVEGAPSPSAESAPGPPTRFALDRLVLSGASIRWSDAAVAPSVETTLSGGATVMGLVVGDDDAPPVEVQVTAGLEGVLEQLNLTAAASLGATRTDIESTLRLVGLRAGPLASYLPPEVIVLLEDGRLETSLRATLDVNEEGGQSIVAEMDGLGLRDGEQGAPLLAFDGLRVDVPRLDPAGAFYDVEEISVAGFAFEVEKVSATRYEALGVAFDSARGPGAGSAPEVKIPEVGVPEVEIPEEGAAQPEAPGEAALEGDASAPAGGAAAPTIRLGKLDLGIDRLRYIDRTRADAVPLDLSLALVTPEPQVLSRPDPRDLPPTRLSVVGALDPIIGSIEFAATLEPFSADPGVQVTLELSGIDGAQLARVDPALAASLDPSDYKDGSITTAADLRLAFARRGPADFDLARGFGGRLSVDGFALRPTPDARPTGFERLDVEIKRVDPTSGDVRIASIDLGGVFARLEQSERGLGVAGLVFPAPVDDAPPAESAEGGAAEGSEPVAEAEADAAGTPEGADGPDPAGPEISIDRLTVSGFDVALLDTTTDPVTSLPIADLQLELKRFTTRTLVEPRPFSFRLVVDAGEVTLPQRGGNDYLLTGVLGSLGSAVTGAKDTFRTEERRLWDQLEVTGRLSLGPSPRGRVQAGLLGLELPAFRGMARAAGVEIGDGLLDNRTALRFREDGTLSVDAKTTTTFLSLSEPPGGPISKYLSLPAPLDTVLFLLRNDEAQQELPVRIDVAEDGLSGSQLASQIGQVLGLLVTDAVSSAPLRVLGPLGDVAGALGLTSVPPTAETVTLDFGGGVAALADGAPLAEVANALRNNPDLRVVIQAEFGAQDLAVAERLANPPRATIDALIANLRDRKAVAERRRVEASAIARAQYTVGALESARASTVELQRLDGERRDIELALEELFALVRPGAESRRELRTRNAALALGLERLDRVRNALIELAGPASAERVDARRPRYRRPSPDEPLPALGRVTVTPR